MSGFKKVEDITLLGLRICDQIHTEHGYLHTRFKLYYRHFIVTLIEIVMYEPSITALLFDS